MTCKDPLLYSIPSTWNASWGFPVLNREGALATLHAYCTHDEKKCTLGWNLPKRSTIFLPPLPKTRLPKIIKQSLIIFFLMKYISSLACWPASQRLNESVSYFMRNARSSSEYWWRSFTGADMSLSREGIGSEATPSKVKVCSSSFSSRTRDGTTWEEV